MCYCLKQGPNHLPKDLVTTFLGVIQPFTHWAPPNLTFNQMPFAQNLPASLNLWNLQHITRGEGNKGRRLETSLVISLLIQFYKGQMQPQGKQV